MDRRIQYKKLLFDVIDILEKNNIKYYLDYGTLLGAIREKNFIKNDHDMDLGIYETFWRNFDKLKQIILDFDKKNIEIIKIWDNSINGIVTIKRNNVQLDLFHKIRGAKNYYKYGKRGKRIYPLKCLDTLDIIDFLGKKVKVPSFTIEYIEYLYGKDWKTPMPKSGYGGHTKNVIPIKYNYEGKLSIKIPYFVSLYVDKKEYLENE